jgi:cysteinyl-tRNA synthetase
MSEQELGETFDIHGGGLDLIFPHHENEIAQSVCAHDGHPFARYWLHNGMLTVGGAKMAKSEGNFVTVRDALGEWPGEVIRLALLGTHYRDPLDWTDERMHQAQTDLDRFYRALGQLVIYPAGRPPKPLELPPEAAMVLQSLEDDLNAPLAITHMHRIADAIYRAKNPAECEQYQFGLRFVGNLLGLLSEPPLLWLRRGMSLSAAVIEMRIAERTEARRDRRFADADRIRAALVELGVILEDKPDGTTEWRRG